MQTEKIDSLVRFKIDTLVTGSSGVKVAALPPHKRANWTWAYTAGIGISGVGKNFGSFGEEKSLMADNLSGGPNGGPGTPSNAPTYKPSPVKNDLSFFFRRIGHQEIRPAVFLFSGNAVQLLQYENCRGSSAS